MNFPFMNVNPAQDIYKLAEDCVRAGDYTNFPEQAFENEDFICHCMENISHNLYLMIPKKYKTVRICSTMSRLLSEKMKQMVINEELTEGVDNIKL